MDILNVEGDQLTPAEPTREAEEQQSAITGPRGGGRGCGRKEQRQVVGGERRLLCWCRPVFTTNPYYRKSNQLIGSGGGESGEPMDFGDGGKAPPNG